MRHTPPPGWTTSPTPWPQEPPRWTEPPPYPPQSPPDQQQAIDLALLRQGMTHLTDRVNAHSGRIEAHDERIRKQGSRIGKLEDQAAGHALALAKVESLPGQIQALTSRGEMLVTAAKYVGGAIILALASAGKIPWEHAMALIGRPGG